MKKLNDFFILTLHDSLVFIVFANGAPYDDFHRCLGPSLGRDVTHARQGASFPSLPTQTRIQIIERA